MLFLWIALYGLVNLVPETVSGNESLSEWLHAGLLTGYSIAFLCWIHGQKKRKEIGVQWPRMLPKEACFLLPLAVFPVYNLFLHQEISVSLAFVLQMLCVALTEELFFRGFLLSSLRKYGCLPAVLLTSTVFALLHGLNFLQYSDSIYVWMQIGSGFCVSLYYSCFVMRFGSILPCVAAHFLTNITAAGRIDDWCAYAGVAGSMIICFLFSRILIVSIKKETVT